VRETEHFLIHFPAGEREAAERCAAWAEDIHASLTRRMGWIPGERTAVVLDDGRDEANGMATVFPDNRITILLTPPLEPAGMGVPHGDWMRLVLAHEYAHILQLDMARRLPRLLRYVVGRLYFPNALQPSWLVEGLATWLETEETGEGRGVASATAMVLRMAALAGEIPGLDRLSVAPTGWPGGAVPYLHGQDFIRFLARRYGPERVAEVSLLHAGRTVPFLVDSTARLVFDRGWPELWQEWREDLTARALAEVGGLPESGPTASTPLTSRGHRTWYPRFAPDGGRLAYYAADPFGPPGIRVMNADGSGDRLAVEILAAASTHGAAPAWSSDGRGLFYARLEHAGTDLRSDLFYLDLASGREHRLTRALRARDPEPVPGGLLCVAGGPGREELTLVPLPPGFPEEPAGEPRPWGSARVPLPSIPRLEPGGGRLAVASRRGGRQEVRLLEGTADLPAGSGGAVEGAPAWSADGRHLFFSSDAGGVTEIHALEVATGRRFRVTRSPGGSFMPAPSPDGRRLVLVRYGARGYDLHRLDLDPALWEELPVPPGPFGEGIAVQLPSPPAPPGAERAYSPWGSLLPRFWIPWWSSSPGGGTEVGLATAGWDVLERHAWFFSGFREGDEGRVSYALDYRYDGFTPTLTLSLSDLEVTTPDLVGWRDYRERRRTRAAAASLVFPGTRERGLVSLGLRRRQQVPRSSGDWSGAAFTGESASLLLGLGYGSTRRYPASLGEEDGVSADLDLEWSTPRLGGELARRALTLGLGRHRSLPGRQILSLRLQGGWADGDPFPQGWFRLGGEGTGEEVPSPDRETIPLRGYPAGVARGDRLALLGLEWRVPLLEADRGWGTAPLFLRRLRGSLFAEAGSAWTTEFRAGEIRRSAGLEVAADLVAGYLLPVTLRLGLARGFDRDGRGRLSVLLTLGPEVRRSDPAHP
jgi:hypothetical protein